eukprot:5239140-Pleurochrysis_carterae.AAC.1
MDAPSPIAPTFTFQTTPATAAAANRKTCSTPAGTAAAAAPPASATPVSTATTVRPLIADERAHFVTCQMAKKSASRRGRWKCTRRSRRTAAM